MKGEIDTLHNPFIAFLRAKGLNYVHADPSRKSTIAKGWPDFTVILPNSANRSVLIEFKTARGKLSADQTKCIDGLRLNGIAVTVRTDLASAQRDVLEAIAGQTPPTAALSRDAASGGFTIRNVPGEGDFVFHGEMRIRRALVADLSLPRKD